MKENTDRVETYLMAPNQQCYFSLQLHAFTCYCTDFLLSLTSFSRLRGIIQIHKMVLESLCTLLLYFGVNMSLNIVRFLHNLKYMGSNKVK